MCRGSCIDLFIFTLLVHTISLIPRPILVLCFCSLVCVQYITRKQKSGASVYNANRRTKVGETWNKATYLSLVLYMHCKVKRRTFQKVLPLDIYTFAYRFG